MKAILIGFCSLMIGISSAFADPPAKGSEDWKLMNDFSEWITNQKDNKGNSCCDVSDGRPLFENEWRQINIGYEVFISRRHWDDAPEQGFWMTVPRTAIIAGSPLGMPIVWWRRWDEQPRGHIYCFAPVSWG
jgi:hypothetical protein